MPSAVDIMNYISSGLLWRIFCQTGIFAGFSLHIINFAVRSSEAAMGRGHYIVQGSCSSFRVRRSSVGCSLAQWKNMCPWRPEFGPEGRHFVSGNSYLLFGGSSEAAMDGGRAAPRWAWQ